MTKLDAMDVRILTLLQQDARLTHAEIAEQIGASQTSVWRRIRELEKAGVVASYVTLVNPKAVGRNVNVVSHVKLSRHGDEPRQAFEKFVHSRSEIMECYAMAGEQDYLLRTVVRDVEEFEHFLMTQLLHHPSVASSNSSFALRQIAYKTALPLDPPANDG